MDGVSTPTADPMLPVPIFLLMVIALDKPPMYPGKLVLRRLYREG